MAITGEAAGTRYVAAPPAASGRRLVVVWHLRGTPGTPEDMAAAVPLTGVDAWRLYPALPPWDHHPDGHVHGYASMVETAVDALPALVRAARERFGCDDGPVDLVGGSAGGHVALLATTRDLVPVRRLAVVNPAVTAQAVVEASIDAGALDAHPWTDANVAAAEPLDVLARAAELDLPLLLLRGEHEYPAFRPVQEALCAAAPDARLVDVPGLPHMLVPTPDGPDVVATVDAEVTAWLA
ncbi:alpha/beta fold hydrolase [Saccharothrix hoggarensis]|uniref:Prolyl oligopeptidase family protein n=1 Tax=Saccharothrix hoggarensis TaxID=913853 RepID=A0ABW3QXK4_9PSEU